jgi:FkbH-like protein
MRNSPMNNSPIKEQIDSALQEKRYAEAGRILQGMMASHLDSATAAYVAARADDLAPHLSLQTLRICLLRSFTIEPIIPFLQAQCFSAGFHAEIRTGGFNTYAQDFLDGSSSLYATASDIVFLAVRTADIAPELWNPVSPADSKLAIDQALTDMESWLTAFRARSGAAIVLQNFEQPPFPAAGIFDAQQSEGQQSSIRKLNAGLGDLARRFPSVYILDYDGLVARHGRLAWHDEAKWQSIRLPVTADHFVHLADEYMRFIRSLTGKTCKALVLDLDNTLWGGVIGEEGPEGIRLGPDYPGAAFTALQQVIENLYRRGILLAICSKNNWEDVYPVFDRHRGMRLRQEHFAAIRVNWQDKATNLREIAAELNIGTDALAFLDDDPMEREWIRSQMPEVTILPIAEKPYERAQALLQSPVFERLSLSEEDQQRGRLYADQRLRKELQQRSPSLEDFYRSLDMHISFRSASTSTAIGRVAQLTQKTNQFNLTTHRYTEAEITRMVSDPSCTVFTVRVTDRFGDNGIVGVVILNWANQDVEIDTFLLSCRVMGRMVETAMLSEIVRRANARGSRTLCGWFLPTAKNSPAAGFYEAHGFNKCKESSGDTKWELSLETARIETPSWCSMTSEELET